MNKKLFLLLSISFLFFAELSGQVKNLGIPFIKNYTPEDYNGSTQNWSVIQDNRGVMYFGNGDGILTFDGLSWKSISLPNKTVVRSFAKDKNGKIYVGGVDEFGYIASDSLGRTVFKSLLSKIPENKRTFKDIWRMFYVKDAIVLCTSSKIFVIGEKETQVFESKTGYHGGFSVYDKFYTREKEVGIEVLENGKLELIPDGAKFANERVYFMLPFDNGKILAGSRTLGLFLYDGKSFSNWYTSADDYLIKSSVYGALNIGADYIAITTIIDGVIIIDKMGKTIQHIDKERGLQDNTCYYMYLDKQSNLWLALGAGISYVEINSQFTFYDQRHKLEGKMYGAKLHNNTLYAGGEPNLLCKEWLEYENPLLPTNFKLIDKTGGQTWQLKEIDGNLFSTHSLGIFYLNNSEATKIKVNDLNTWILVPVHGKPEYVVAGTNEGLFLLEKNGTSFNIKHKIKGLNADCRYIEVDEIGNWWLSGASKGIHKFRLNGACDSVFKSKVYDAKKGLPSDNNNIVHKVGKHIIAATQKNFYYYSFNDDKFLPFEPFNKHLTKNVKVQIIGKQQNGNVWFVDDDIMGVFVLQNDGSYQAVTKPFMEISKIGSVSQVNEIDDKNLIISHSRGIIHYDPSFSKQFDLPSNTLIRSVENVVNDSVIFGGNYPFNADTFTLQQPMNTIQTLKYQSNSLRFEFASTFYESPERTEYQYKLEGFDKDWSNWSKDTKKEYTKLSEGKYTFKVRSRNVYLTQGNEAAYSFRISPPWYRTIFAYIFYVLLFAFVLYFGIKRYTKSLKEANIRLERIVQERTSEIVKQKEELAAQAVELEKLSIVASETDNAVLIFDKDLNLEWVNAGFTNLYEYTKEEFVKIHSPNIIDTSANDNIKDIINKCIQSHTSISYEVANVTKSGKKIWVQTTLNPILDKDKNIRKMIAVESDITKMKEAEAEIFQQNQQIKASIRYALTIQRAILPIKEEMDKYFQNFIIYRPKDIVSGDFYWFSNICREVNTDCNNTEYIFIAAVDCTGHGVPGAFMSMVGNRLLNEIVNEKKILEPAQVLDNLNLGISKALHQNITDNNDGMDICFCRIESSENENKILFSGAKLPVFYHRFGSDEVIRLKGDSKRIGGVRVRRVESIFTNKELILNKKDMLFLATDGMIDQNDSERKRFGTAKYMQTILQNIDKPLEDMKVSFEIALDKFQLDEQQRDDITVIGIKF